MAGCFQAVQELFVSSGWSRTTRRELGNSHLAMRDFFPRCQLLQTIETRQAMPSIRLTRQLCQKAPASPDCNHLRERCVVPWRCCSWCLYQGGEGRSLDSQSPLSSSNPCLRPLDEETSEQSIASVAQVFRTLMNYSHSCTLAVRRR